MLLKKLLLIMWHDKFTNPFRIFTKSYARYKKGGYANFKNGLNSEYFSLKPIDSDNLKNYHRWIQDNEKNIYHKQTLDYQPMISIITPTYNTDAKFLSKMIESVIKQTYSNWELCVADDASNKQETINALKKYQETCRRMQIIYRTENGNMSEASNSALSITSGEYVAFLDHDDELAPNTLYEMVKKLNENPELKFIYSDEDKIDMTGNRYQPHFKSNWNPDMFVSQNYIANFTLIHKKLIEDVGGFRPGYEGSQDFDLYHRALRGLKQSEIGHIAKVLYHQRATKGSTALHSKEKDYTTQAGIQALQDHFKHLNQEVKISQGFVPNTFKIEYRIPSPAPLVSLLIPTRNGYDVLSKCIQSILDKTLYQNYEIIILDNETDDPKTLEYFNALRKHDFIRILKYNFPFNYSAINNFGVKHAHGELIGLINNDVEIINKGWLTEMVQHTIRPEIGAVGAKLYYDNDTIQHAGVILGIGGVAGHSHKYFPKDANGYFTRLKIVQNLSAVTGACLLVKKSIYEEVGGLNEKDLTVAFNDVDFCLKIQQKGYRNLWTPYAELYHHESMSRGSEDTPEKKARFQKEVLYMISTWKDVLQEDIYYNKNLTLKHENFGLGFNVNK